MNVKIELSRDEVAQLARDEYGRRFGEVPAGHECSGHVSYGELIIEVYPLPTAGEVQPPQSDAPVAVVLGDDDVRDATGS
jgi:hypothetical protein